MDIQVWNNNQNGIMSLMDTVTSEDALRRYSHQIGFREINRVQTDTKHGPMTLVYAELIEFELTFSQFGMDDVRGTYRECQDRISRLPRGTRYCLFDDKGVMVERNA